MRYYIIFIGTLIISIFINNNKILGLTDDVFEKLKQNIKYYVSNNCEYRQ